MPRFKVIFDRPVYLDGASCKAVRDAIEQVSPGGSKAIATCAEVTAADEPTAIVLSPRMVAVLSMGKR